MQEALNWKKKKSQKQNDFLSRIPKVKVSLRHKGFSGIGLYYSLHLIHLYGF